MVKAKKMNNDIKKYIKYVKKIISIHSKDKKEFIQLLTQKIIEFSNEHDSCSYQDIVDEFGSPNEVAGSYIETLDSDEIIKKLNKKKIIALAMSAVMAVGMIAGCGSTNNSGTDTAQTESTEKVTPTFMYFVANADDNFDATNTMYTELENEYKDKINFQLVNVDENPEALENFSLVKDQTPALIMLDTSNNISAIEFKCSDKDKLKTDIDNALGK